MTEQDKATIDALAAEAGVTFVAGALDGSRPALYRFAELLIAHYDTTTTEDAAHEHN